jgi:hypothetical protein
MRLTPNVLVKIDKCLKGRYTLLCLYLHMSLKEVNNYLNLIFYLVFDVPVFERVKDLVFTDPSKILL